MARRFGCDSKCSLILILGILVTWSIHQGLQLRFDSDPHKSSILDAPIIKVPANLESQRHNKSHHQRITSNSATDVVVEDDDQTFVPPPKEVYRGRGQDYVKDLPSAVKRPPPKKNFKPRRKPSQPQRAGSNPLHLVQEYKDIALRTGEEILGGIFGNEHSIHFGSGYRKSPNYRRTIVRKRKPGVKIIYFVHIHKSAGSLLCKLFFRSRVNVNEFRNCNVQKDQYCCGHEDSMEAQIRFAESTVWDLVATEREMLESFAPSHYDYVVCLRRAKDRYFSHWSHLRRVIPIGPGIQKAGFGTSKWLFGNGTVFQTNETQRIVAEGEDPLGSFQEWILGQPDNWNTRILCGAKCRPRAKFQITKELFQYTLERLDRFAHFLFVEDIETSYNKIASAYKWKNYSSAATEYLLEEKSNRRKDKPEGEVALAKESWDPMMSALDDAIYEFAQRKYRNETVQLWDPFVNQKDLERYFEEGPKYGCQDACCQNCTSY